MSNPIKPPEPPLKREHIFSVRLICSERTTIKQLARQMNVSPSPQARHFLMQAIAYYSAKSGGDNAN